MCSHVLVVRLDSMGDMLAAGPAIRAVASRAQRVTVLAGPLGAEAARLLPGVDEVVVWACPWVLNPAPDVSPADVAEVVRRVAGLGVDRAVILTSFHQSPLPTALVLRLAAVPWIGASSEDYPGSLLDARLPVPGEAPEPVRMLQIVRQAGFALPAGDDGRLAVRRPRTNVDAILRLEPEVPFVVVHPGTSAPARAFPQRLWAAAVDRLVGDGWHVVLTGSRAEQQLTGHIVDDLSDSSGGAVTDLAGRLNLPQLAAVLDRAEVTVIANTGPAHLSAAVGTPVVSLFAPVVPAARWAPHGVRVELLGDQEAPCKDTRWVVCRIEGHPCLSQVSPAQITEAVKRVCPADRAPVRELSAL